MSNYPTPYPSAPSYQGGYAQNNYGREDLTWGPEVYGSPTQYGQGTYGGAGQEAYGAQQYEQDVLETLRAQGILSETQYQALLRGVGQVAQAAQGTQQAFQQPPPAPAPEPSPWLTPQVAVGAVTGLLTGLGIGLLVR